MDDHGAEQVEQMHRTAFALPDSWNVKVLTIPHATPPKHRPRSGEHGVYKDDEAAEQTTGFELLNQWKQPMLTDGALLTVIAVRSTMRRVDIDNLVKHIMDAANGVLWKDDSQVFGVLGIKALDPPNPRTIVAVSSCPWEFE